MSIFNPDNYNGINNDLENIILTKVDENYLKKNGGTDTSTTLTNFSNDINISGNIIASTKTISALELSQLDNINTNQTIQQQINSIGGGSGLLTSNNTWQGTQTFNNNIIVDNKNITPIQISYLSNSTSNIQSQINNITSNYLLSSTASSTYQPKLISTSNITTNNISSNGTISIKSGALSNNTLSNIEISSIINTFNSRILLAM